MAANLFFGFGLPRKVDMPRPFTELKSKFVVLPSLSMKCREDKSSIGCRICGKHFRAITANHLTRRHQYDPEHPILEYLQRFRLREFRSIETKRKSWDARIAYLERSGKRWTRERVRSEIRRLQRRGARLNNVFLSRTHGALTAAGANLFGSWRRALAACGIQPDSVLVRRRWTKASVLEELRSLHSQGKAINCGAWIGTGLHEAAINRFASWDAAVRAAGFDPKKIRKFRTWTKAQVLDEIRANKMAIIARQALKNHPSVYGAAVRRFGTWRNAIKAAGLTYPVRSWTRIWTRERILETIRERALRKVSLYSPAIQRWNNGFYKAAIAAFDGWRQAVEAAGCAVELPLQHWTKIELVELLRRIQRTEGRITQELVERVDRRNHVDPVWSILRAFGSWEKALQATGLRPDQIHPFRRWSRKSVVDAVRSDYLRSRPMNYKAMERRNLALLGAGITRFGNWANVLIAAGVQPRNVRLK